ncbi:hypothetical protein F2P79_024330 [Pimephales promelas]|nr:hypothetical protein F2P79_024330 [Pimephales promelas]
MITDRQLGCQEKPLAASCGGHPTRPHPSVTSEATTPMPKLDTFSLIFKNRKKKIFKRRLEDEGNHKCPGCLLAGISPHRRLSRSSFLVWIIIAELKPFLQQLVENGSFLVLLF